MAWQCEHCLKINFHDGIECLICGQNPPTLGADIRAVDIAMQLRKPLKDRVFLPKAFYLGLATCVFLLIAQLNSFWHIETTPLFYEQSHVMLQSLTPAQMPVRYYVDSWDTSVHAGQFQSSTKTYSNGIGLFIPSAQMKTSASTRLGYNISDRNYSQLAFDLAIDKNWNFNPESGDFSLKVLADNAEIWFSGVHDYSYAKENIVLEIPVDTQTLTFELMQRKGKKGTLNVILGDCRLMLDGL